MQMAETTAGWALWVRSHPYLAPVELAAGESGIALLLSLELDQSCPWPSQAEDQDRSSILMGFTRRLNHRVAADMVLAAWQQSDDVQRPPAFGLADTHFTLWSLQVRRPPSDAPQGWWLQFIYVRRLYVTTRHATFQSH